MLLRHPLSGLCRMAAYIYMQVVYSCGISHSISHILLMYGALVD